MKLSIQAPHCNCDQTARNMLTGLEDKGISLIPVMMYTGSPVDFLSILDYFPAIRKLRRADSMYVYHNTLAFEPDFELK